MAETPLLHIDGLSAEAAVDGDGASDGGPVLDGISLRLRSGETGVVIGPSGSPLASLAPILLGAPEHRVTGGRILLRGDDITGWPTDVRAKAGLFLASPRANGPVGVTLLQLLSRAIGARAGIDTDLVDLRTTLLDWGDRLGIDPAVIERPAVDALSPVEARQRELLQLAVLQPEVVVLDETSGGAELDDDSIAALTGGLETVLGQRPTLGTLAISHCQRLLGHLEPDHVHIMVGQRIVASGGPELATQLETEGYESFT